MVLYTNEEKANRKGTIETLRRLHMRDQLLGVEPTKSKVLYHPGWWSKPTACRLGKHDWRTDILMNIPFLTCQRCGATTLKAAHEGTETKRELKTRHIPAPFDLTSILSRLEKEK